MEPYQNQPHYPTLRELPLSERPVNRLHRHGTSGLSNTELLAVLAGSTTQLREAASLLATFQGIEGVAKANSTELEQQHGIGATTSARIQAAFELGRRLATEPTPERLQIRSPADAGLLLVSDMGLLDKEELRVMLLDNKNRILTIVTVYIGSVNATMIRVAEVFREAVRRGCPTIIVAHNHPSGDPAPSPADVAVTKQIVEVGKLLDIDVLDHLIIGRHKFVSMKEQGLGFP